VTDGDDAAANPWYNFQYKVAGLQINWQRYNTSSLYSLFFLSAHLFFFKISLLSTLL
jgi:hypothetical protein